MVVVHVLVVALVWLVASSAEAGWFKNRMHNATVRRSGIQPAGVGSYEGVGVSTNGPDAAMKAACYWGQKEPLSVQHSYRNGKYYAVVRYR